MPPWDHPQALRQHRAIRGGHGEVRIESQKVALRCPGEDDIHCIVGTDVVPECVNSWQHRHQSLTGPRDRAPLAALAHELGATRMVGMLFDETPPRPMPEQR